jgi:hypothetical protein
MGACALLPCWRSELRMRTVSLLEVRWEHAPCFPDRGQNCACALLSCWSLQVRWEHEYCSPDRGQLCACAHLFARPERLIMVLCWRSNLHMNTDSLLEIKRTVSEYAHCSARNQIFPLLPCWRSDVLMRIIPCRFMNFSKAHAQLAHQHLPLEFELMPS